MIENILETANVLKLKSIAFSEEPSGIYGFPK